MSSRRAQLFLRGFAGALALVMLGVMPAAAQVPSLSSVSKLTITGVTQIEINKTLVYSGSMTILDIPAPKQKIELTIDGVVTDDTETNNAGGYSVEVSFANYGSYNLQAVVHRGTLLEARSEILRVEAIAPSQETTTTDVAESSEFLYEGPNAVQQGVAPGTIEPVQAAVVRGSVAKADGTPLTGVEVSIADHPEFGNTETTQDAVFDMAVNGGDYLTVRFEKDGYLPVERELDVGVRDYEVAPDIVMTPLDPAVTTIDLDDATEMQVARGSVVSDDAGSRQATLLFPQGTKAVMELPRARASSPIRARTQLLI